MTQSTTEIKVVETLEDRFKRLQANATSIIEEVYGDTEEDDREKAELERVEKAMAIWNRKLSSPARNRWNLGAASYISQQLISKHLNSMKTGIYSVFPIPCKQKDCPYGYSCIALQNNLQPKMGEPCLIEITKIENLVIGYSKQFDLDNTSMTDMVLLKEIIQLDLVIDRCQNLMAKDVNPLQDVTMGTTEDGEVYTQPVVSRFFDEYERASKRRQSLLDEMMATRKSKKGLKEEPVNQERMLLNIINGVSDFEDVEERPEKFK
jgi:hypothetical protein